MKNKSLKINAMFNVIKSLLSIIFPIISFPYVSRILSVDALGSYNFSSSLINYCMLLAGLGISSYAIREGTQYRNEHVKMSKFVSEVFSINILSTVVSYILLIICVSCVDLLQKYYLMLFILSFQIIFTTIGVNWLCNIYEDFLYITLRTFLVQLTSLIAMFIFVKKETDIIYYIIIVTIANSIANAFNFIYIRKKYVDFKFVLDRELLRHLKPILTIFATAITITIYVSSDITILGLLLNDFQVGLYSASVKVYMMIKNLLVAIVMVLVPRFCILIKTNEGQVVDKFFSYIFNTVSSLLIPTSVGILMLGSEIMQFIAGANYSSAGLSLSILSMSTVFSLYSYLYINCILLPYKKETVVLKATLISAIVNVILNFILIGFWGINAAAISTVIAELIICVFSIHEGRKKVSLVNTKKPFCIVLVGCTGIIFICMFLKMLVESHLGRIVYSIIASVALYSIVLASFRHPLYLEIKEKVKTLRNRGKKSQEND